MHSRLLTLLHTLEHHHPFPAVELKLERMREFLRLSDNPQQRIPPAIHVAGTNGKGSVLAFLHAMIQAAGQSAHRYTSPHLVSFHERYILTNRQITDEALLGALERLVPELQAYPLTYFEAATALAFRLFAGHPADYTLLEVGMGGRLDATNVIDHPIATIMMPVSLDHQDFLGDTVAKIAYEKACIMKAGTPCIIGHQVAEARDVMLNHAKEIDAPVHMLGQDWEYRMTADGSLHYQSHSLSITTPPPALSGAHQYGNAATAIACVDRLGILTPEAVKGGVATAAWPGRLQRIRTPLTHHAVFLDGGHNPSAAAMLNQWISGQSLPVHIIFGMHQDKDVSGALRLLLPHAASLHCVKMKGDPKAVPALELAGIVKVLQYDGRAHAGLGEALAFLTVTNPESAIILVTGSLYLVGEALSLFTNA